MEYQELESNIDDTKPLIYLWEIRDVETSAVTYRYVGKSKNGGARPRQHYRRNVLNLLAGRLYRPSRPVAFRKVHRRLADAVRSGQQITLRFLENVPPSEDIKVAERRWQRHYGLLM